MKDPAVKVARNALPQTARMAHAAGLLVQEIYAVKSARIIGTTDRAGEVSGPNH